MSYLVRSVKFALALTGAIACTDDRSSRSRVDQPYSVADLAPAYSAALQSERETTGPFVALSPVAALPDSAVVQAANLPDTVRLSTALLNVLRALPEVAGLCDIRDADMEMASYCNLPPPSVPVVRYAIRVTPPEWRDSATVDLSIWYIRVHPSRDSMPVAPSFAFSMHYSFTRRDTIWQLTQRRRLSIT